MYSFPLVGVGGAGASVVIVLVHRMATPQARFATMHVRKTEHACERTKFLCRTLDDALINTNTLRHAGRRAVRHKEYQA